MNKENLIKKFFVFIILLFLCFTIYGFILNNVIIIVSGILCGLILFISLSIFELYLRIQHNIDETKRLNDKIISENFKQVLNELVCIRKENKENILNNQKTIVNITDIVLNNQKAIVNITDIVLKDFCFIKESINKNSEVIKTKLDGLNKNNEEIKQKLNIQYGGLSKFYWSYVKDRRSDVLVKFVPNIFNYKSVLYIGARPDRTDFLQDFKNSGYDISILEIYKPNVEYFKNDSRFKEVIEGDVVEFDSNKKYDIIFWWHGPEHVEKNKLESTLKRLELITNNFIILGCPWGDVPQGSGYEYNLAEKHINFIKTGDLENYGFKVSYSGLENSDGSSIIAVKEKK